MLALIDAWFKEQQRVDNKFPVSLSFPIRSNL